MVIIWKPHRTQNLEQQPYLQLKTSTFIGSAKSVGAAAAAYSEQHGRGQLGDWTTVASIIASRV